MLVAGNQLAGVSDDLGVVGDQHAAAGVLITSLWGAAPSVWQYALTYAALSLLDRERRKQSRAALGAITRDVNRVDVLLSSRCIITNTRLASVAGQ